MVEKPAAVITKPDEPLVATNPTRSDVRAKREQSEFNVRRLVQAAADNSTRTDAKQEVGQSAKPETRPQVVGRPTTPLPASSNKKAQESAREKSRSSDEAEARPNERGNGREKKDRD